MENRTFIFSFDQLKLSVSGVEEVIGFNEGEDREFMRSVIDQILDEVSRIAEVKAEYRIFPDAGFIMDGKKVAISGKVFDVKNIVFSQVKKSGSVAIFLCTAGEEIGIRSRKAMQERDLLTGYIYDVIGSEVVEAAADLMQAGLAKAAEDEGLGITNRYSPGYCGWNVSEQHILFSLMPDNFCGIRLTPSALMDPVKSVSGIIGMGKDVKMNPYQCRMCDMHDCIYRRHRENTAK